MKWWGNQDLWLDMLVTEIALKIGARIGLEREFGNDWVVAVESWLDSAYKKATTGNDNPPSQAICGTKALPIVEQVLRNARAPADILASGSGRRFVRTVAPKQLGREAVAAANRNRDRHDNEEASRVAMCRGNIRVIGDSREKSSIDEARKSSKQAREQTDWKALPRINLSAESNGSIGGWGQAEEVEWCHGGSGGAIFVKLRAGVICAKSCSPEELFAQHLADLLGVPVAQMQVLPPYSQERLRFQDGVEAIAPSYGEDNVLQIKKILRSRALALMQFVDGVGMMGMPAHGYLRQNDSGLPPWHDLGRLMAFDLLINNFDRLPLAWTNEGNLSNIMLGSSLAAVVGIDQCVAPITHPDGLHRYTSRVQKAVQEARDGEGKSFAAVKEAIYNNTAADLTSEELAALREGCLSFASEASSRLVRGGDLDGELERISSKVCAIFPDGGGARNPHSPRVADQMKRCCDLVVEVAHAIQEVLA